MRQLYKYSLITLSMLLAITISAQDTDEKEKKPARPAFESQLLIDNQTVVIPTKGTFEWDMQHRFGAVENGFSDLFGLYAPSNIRMGFTYSVLDKLNLGYGFTKFNRFSDFNLKYLIFQQTRDNSMPVSIAYYGVAAINASDAAQEYGSFVRQLSYFNQLLIARRFGPNFSLQVSPSYSHFNAVDREGPDVESHDIFGLGVSGRYKVASVLAIIFDYSQPLNEHSGDVPIEPNIGFGIETATSSHAFQVFVSNYQSLIPQYNLAYNTNPFDGSGILIGFNITRLWNF